MAKTINGMEFEISQPYAEGHSCTAAEARALNQTRSENIGNNARAKIKEMLEKSESEDAIREFVAGLDANYIFTLAGVSASRKLDPVEREANKLARELLKDHLATTGRKLTKAPDGMTDEEWDDKVAAQIEQIATNPEVLKAAKKNVDAKAKQAAALVEAMGGVSV